MIQQKRITSLLLFITLLLSGCGFHLQGETVLAPPLHRLHIQSADPYGQLVRNLEQGLKMSHVEVVPTADQAETVLNIISDTATQTLLSTSGTQQVRQYNLAVTVTFEVTNNKGAVIVPPQALGTSRTLTVQANDILGSSNEASLFYSQMRRSLAYSILTRLSSQQVTGAVNAAFVTKKKK